MEINHSLQTIGQSIEQPFSAADIFPHMKAEIMEGKTDITKAYYFLHQMSALFEAFKKDRDLKHGIESEMTKYDGQKLYGFKPKVISKKMANWETCTNADYLNLKENFEACKKHCEENGEVEFTNLSYVELRKAA